MNKKEILLARHSATLAMVYAVIAMALGVFYREFTKFSGFAGIPTILHWEWCFFLS